MHEGDHLMKERAFQEKNVAILWLSVQRRGRAINNMGKYPTTTVEAQHIPHPSLHDTHFAVARRTEADETGVHASCS